MIVTGDNGLPALQSISRRSDAMRWDHGSHGLANRDRLVIEEHQEHDLVSGKEVKIQRARRADGIEVKSRQGVLGAREIAAALALREAYEQTMLSHGAPDNDRVDRSKAADEDIVVRLSRIARFSELRKAIPSDYWRVVSNHVLNDVRLLQPADEAHLSRALRAVAAAMES